MRPIKKLLVANRGEIALRVLRACREEGIATVAVYSEADRNALHVGYADEARLLGAGPPAESYLHIPRIIEAARSTGADAVHPGYGFLSENAGFAQACADAGLTFVGPPPQAIRLLGDKSTARQTMEGAGIPLVPGTGRISDPAVAAAFADGSGYPVLVKAAGGGGGRGIRIVHAPDELAGALSLASQEAEQAFGDAGVYMEKYIAPARHVEIQVMADNHGTVVGLGERECSVQRRHQKIIEEAPSVAVDPGLRSRMVAAAVAAARAAGYRGAGTVEFLVGRGGAFYFLEVNTRLQVEHPVTELLTGRDLVRDQLRVASGAPLGYSQADVVARGWAMECRVTAEDPRNGFLPSLGTVRLVQAPSGPGVRLDSCLFDGLEVPPFYDSLLAKVIVWGEDRPQAIARMRRALQEFVILGVRTNIPFHLFLLDHPRFQAGDISTGFLEEVAGEFAAVAAGNEAIAAVAAAVMAHTGRGPGTPAAGAVEAGPAGSRWASAYRMRNSGYWRV